MKVKSSCKTLTTYFLLQNPKQFCIFVFTAERKSCYIVCLLMQTNFFMQPILSYNTHYKVVLHLILNLFSEVDNKFLFHSMFC